MEFRVAAVLRGHQDKVTCCAFSADGASLVSGSFDSSVRVWDSETGAETAVLNGHTRTVISCCFVQNSEKVLSASWDGTLRIWDATSGKATHTFTNSRQRMPSCCCLSPDGSAVAMGLREETTLRYWEVNEHRDVTAFQMGTGHYVRCCAFSPNGSLLMSGADDASLRIVDLRSRKPVAALVGHKSAVTCCSFSPDGLTVASGSEDTTVRLWDWRNMSTKGPSVREGHSKSVSGCAFSPDGGHIVSSSFDNTLRLWSLTDPSALAVFHGHKEEVRCCTWSPRGNQIASGSYDCTLLSWDRGPRPSTSGSCSPEPRETLRIATPPPAVTLSQQSFDVSTVAWTPLQMLLAGTHKRLGAESPVALLRGNPRVMDRLIAAAKRMRLFTPSGKLVVSGEDMPEPEVLPEEGDDDSDIPLPDAVREMDLPRGACSISCGASFSCALLENGQVYSWGTNRFGELGTGSRTHREQPQTAPIQWSQRIITQVSCGASHSLALLGSGEILCWGKNDDGQLGLAETRHKPSPQLLSFFTQNRRAVSVACGFSHNVVLTQNGAVYSWGKNDCGQLGVGDTVNRSVPQPVPGFPRTEGRVLQLACGNEHSVALLETGELFTWGGCLGVEYNVAKRVEVDERIVKVACGAAHTVVLSESGSLYSWGKNNIYQLGHGDQTDRSFEHVEKIDALEDEEIEHVSCGRDFTIAVTRDGIAYGWGDNDVEQLCGLRASKVRVPKKLKIPDKRTVSGVVCGHHHVVLAVV